MAGTASNADHNYNWHDSIHGPIGGQGQNPCGYDTQAPCDDHGHGTHTTGLAVGDDGAGNQIGVAPGAKWIGCHNMDQGVGRPETYTECFQWFIAPTDLTGQNPDPTKRPHVMNNSWGCPTSELCAPDSLQQIVENTTAAGIFVEVSAGNADLAARGQRPAGDLRRFLLDRCHEHGRDEPRVLQQPRAPSRSTARTGSSPTSRLRGTRTGRR